ncbi:MAG: glycine cleavage system protein H [bacterium]
MVAIMVALTIIGLVILDLVIQHIRGKKAQIQQPAKLNFADFKVPKNTFFYPGHTWVKILENGEVRVGIDDFVRKVVGEIEEIEVPEEGRLLKQGEKAFTIKVGNKAISFRAPVDGKITRINTFILTNPKEVTKSVYNSGWIMSIKPTNLATNLKVMKIAEDAVEWLKAEIRRFREFAFGENLHYVKDELQYEVGQTSQDGGCLTEGMLGRMDEKAIKYFEEEFLAR